MTLTFNANLIREISWDLSIWLDPHRATPVGAIPWQGWRFVARPASKDSRHQEIDCLDDSFAQIIGYAEDFRADLDWRDESGDPVNLRTLQPTLDASQRWLSAINRWSDEAKGLRHCTNLFSDGEYRITTERLMTVNGMSWWQPSEWSQAYNNEDVLAFAFQSLIEASQ